jgi:uncharacterized protein with HEPN domain
MSHDRDFLEDIVVAARLAQSYAATITREDLSGNIEKQDSIVRRLAVIGEASTKLPETVKADLPGIPWSSIIGLRNILVHQYWELDLDELWMIIQRDLPDLMRAIERYRSLH